MNIRLTGEIQGLEEGIRIICGELGVEVAEDGIEITVVRAKGALEASCLNGKGRITYELPIHFFRALGLWFEHYRVQTEFAVSEMPQFESNGAMVDASRNAVPTVDAVKTLLRKMALMGLNLFMLYTEDTFTVEEYPYFGYMRGRYSESELKECDDYAHSLGIEIVPCIQTLAHLTEALKWNYAGDIRDTSDILLAGEDKTYTFIERTIAAASKPFRSKRIHIGMDEAHNLGLGRYLEKNGYRKRFDIMNEHLKKVVDIAEGQGLSPMIWSDMYFRLGSKTGNYYDLQTNIPDEVIAEMPKSVQFVYWDYYHGDPSFYKDFIRMHKRFGSMPVFAGGVWTWNGIAPNYGKTFVTTEAALQACKAEGVREVFATMWGDNGAETPLFTSLAGLQLFAEHGYAEEVDREKLERRFAFCTGGNFADFVELNELDETPGISANNMQESNPSKILLWQDVLIGLYDFNIKGLALDAHYAAVREKLQLAVERNGPWNPLFDFYRVLADVLSVKSEFGLRLKEAYDRQDRAALTALSGELKPLSEQVDELRRLHRKLWFSVCKPFGWEVLDIRYGGILFRLETARQRIADYLQGDIPRIDELEAERLYYDAPWKMSEGTLGRGAYHRIVTAGTFSG